MCHLLWHKTFNKQHKEIAMKRLVVFFGLFFVLVSSLLGLFLLVTPTLLAQQIRPETFLPMVSDFHVGESLQGPLLFEQAISFEDFSDHTFLVAEAKDEMVFAYTDSSTTREQHHVITSEDQLVYPFLKTVVFGDFNFSATNETDSRSGFSEGQFVLHFAGASSEKVSYFGELSFTARADAGTGSPAAPGFNPEVERAIIRFDQSDYFKVSLGRYHTPINWWNTAFHHGLWLQTTIGRPEMTKFGGQFIPVHFVGGLIEGTLPASGLNINYNLGLGNGRGSIISKSGDAGDNNNNRAWLINLFVKPDALFGLQAGGSAYRDKITLASGREFDEWIVAGHFVWQKEDPEVIAEVANINHVDVVTSTSYKSLAYYIQIAYRLPWFENVLKPYVRYEFIDIDADEKVFTTVPGLKGIIAGVRYDISDFAALKGEYRNIRRPDKKTVDGLFLQTSFTF
jgi:hypothetical protein